MMKSEDFVVYYIEWFIVDGTCWMVGWWGFEWLDGWVLDGWMDGWMVVQKGGWMYV